MNQAEIKKNKEESILKELIIEGISMLGNESLNSLVVLDVSISKGRDDAKVFLDKSALTEEEIDSILKQLNKAKYTIQSHCFEHSGWFKVPTLHFIFDATKEKNEKIDSLLEKAKKEINNNE